MSKSPNEFGFDESLEFPSRPISQYIGKDEFNTNANATDSYDSSDDKKSLKIVSAIVALLLTTSSAGALFWGYDGQNEQSKDENISQISYENQMTTHSFYIERNNF